MTAATARKPDLPDTEPAKISAGGVKKTRNVGLKVITANDLMSGVVVYYTGATWTEDLAEARVVEGDAAMDLLNLATADEASVVGPYLMDIERDGYAIAPSGRATLRERIRKIGPTIHPEFRRSLEAV